MTIMPAGHRVLVKLNPVDDEEVSKGGIVLASADKSVRQRATQEAVVIDLGATAYHDLGEHPWCEIGDTVLIAQYSGVDRTDPDTDEIYRIINDEDVLAVLGA